MPTYVIFEPDSGLLEVYRLQAKRYELLLVKMITWFAVPALLEGRMMEVLNVLQVGIADPTHQAFIETMTK
ncbi:MAG: hypothetical protein LH647_05535 [Leptolyngbyaceae cyanobacterium CAN_BIN12]|nr:hypothetical protein [Leptolyngbyaceae cyanobacterium CAN_BIN12]